MAESAISPLGEVALAATTLYVQDLDAAVAWYGEKLGLTPLTLGKDAEAYASFLMGGGIVVLEPMSAAMEPASPGSESTTINLVVDRDPNEVREDLLARGVACSEIVASPHFKSFLVRDLDGNRFYVTRPTTDQARRDVADTAATSQS